VNDKTIIDKDTTDLLKTYLLKQLATFETVNRDNDNLIKAAEAFSIRIQNIKPSDLANGVSLS